MQLTPSDAKILPWTLGHLFFGAKKLVASTNALKILGAVVRQCKALKKLL